MKPGCELLLRALRAPEDLPGLPAREWDLLIRLARRANLLARLAVLVESASVEAPPEVQPHLESARILAAHQRQVVRREVSRICRALQHVGCPVVLLKGAAYVMADLPPARGRLFGDVDILVPREALDEAEHALRRAGWTSQEYGAYDQRYYRRWMHELPPMRHVRRGTVVDVHHDILPPTGRLRTDPARIIAAARPLDEGSVIHVPIPEDLVLHSATHLFHDGELDQGLRDLVDLDLLIRHHGLGEAGWPRLRERVAELGLGRPLYHAAVQARRLLRTPMSEAVPEYLAAVAALPPTLAAVMGHLFERALAPDHRACDHWDTAFARWLLYVRSHALRMPMRLLLPHLLRKAWAGT